MPRLRAGRLALAALVLLLSACGSGPNAPGTPRLGEPRQLDPSDYRAYGIPRQFGDLRPTDWRGRIAPDRYAVHGIDAARYQGEIDFAAARASGVEFAWLKATEGGDYADPAFALNHANARAAGVPVGAYHFYYFCRTAREQASWFIQNVPRRQGDLPPVLDMEWNHQSRTCRLRPDPATVRADIRTYLDIVGRHYGTVPVVYTTPDFYEENGLGAIQGAEFWLRSVAGHPSERYPQESWSFWQYTGTGVVRGIGGQVDLNAFAGSRSSWTRWLQIRRQN
ncbi:glycoside hydrolase family 25 protein [Mangrovicoccus sp. HB182678]|uniref:Glycoside hydrolase family 25 protein n=2 Tax=Mangrovicoccus algicola TaxID=2771008 RepID=A0A8J6ZAP7_9RHOB|nr:glycoside hydrolase family 25 protein [Mangrovicoccus algicola]